MQNKVGDAAVRALAVEAQVCPATIRKVLAGLPVRGAAGQRARCALTVNGWLSAETDGKASQP